MKSILAALSIGTIVGIWEIIPFFKFSDDPSVAKFPFWVSAVKGFIIVLWSLPYIPWWLNGVVVAMIVGIPLYIVGRLSYGKFPLPFLVHDIRLGLIAGILAHFFV